MLSASEGSGEASEGLSEGVGDEVASEGSDGVGDSSGFPLLPSLEPVSETGSVLSASEGSEAASSGLPEGVGEEVCEGFEVASVVSDGVGDSSAFPLLPSLEASSGAEGDVVADSLAD